MGIQSEIVIAASEPIYLSGLDQILSECNRFKIVGEATDGEDARELIFALKPAIAIVAAFLPQRDGFEIAGEILTHSSSIGVIILTENASKSEINRAMNLGVNGYMRKDSPASFLIEAVDAVIGGKNIMSLVKRAGES